MTTNESTYLVDQFAVLERLRDDLLKIRLFPFGRIVKNGVEKIITPELAARFRLPHFKPPLKLGSHEDSTPAGGNIIGLEVGDDGLYGLIATTDKGNRAIDDRDYSYHSPEVIWDDGFLEHPDTGEPIRGPLIVGDALLHTPHLGEAAALYSVEPILHGGAEPMTATEQMIPLSALERVREWFAPRPQEPEPNPQPEPQAGQVDYAAELKAKDEQVELLQAQIAQMESDGARGTRIAHFAAELPDEGEDTHAILADLPKETAEQLATRFKALYAQIEAQPDADVGRQGDPDGLGTDATVAFDAAVKAHMAEHGVHYGVAAQAVAKAQPELYAQYRGGGE